MTINLTSSNALGVLMSPADDAWRKLDTTKHNHNQPQAQNHKLMKLDSKQQPSPQVLAAILTPRAELQLAPTTNNNSPSIYHHNQNNIKSASKQQVQLAIMPTQTQATNMQQHHSQHQQQPVCSRRLVAPAPLLMFSETSVIVRQRAVEALVLTRATRAQQRRCLVLALLVSSYCIVGCAPVLRQFATAAPAVAVAAKQGDLGAALLHKELQQHHHQEQHQPEQQKADDLQLAVAAADYKLLREIIENTQSSFEEANEADENYDVESLIVSEALKALVTRLSSSPNLRQQLATASLPQNLSPGEQTSISYSSSHRLAKRSGISDQRLAELQMIRALKKHLERASRLAAAASIANTKQDATDSASTVSTGDEQVKE